MKQRPAGITILAVLALLGGALALLGAISGMLGAWAFGADPTATLLYGVYSLGLAVLYVAFASGMWNLAPWAWTVGIVTTVLSVLWALYGVLVAGNIGALGALVASCVILWYLFQPKVKQAFGRS